MISVLHVVGARPNFMKVAPLMAELECRAGVRQVLVHTGQHYDDAMSGAFFRDLGMRSPDVNLGVGSATHAVQTAAVMQAFEPVLVETSPDVVSVVGDVNSTLACALVAAKRLVPVAHVEAGLRSGDRTMPEEINRVLTDRLSDFLFTPSADADRNLVAEGIDALRIHRVGNVMVDSLLAHRDRAAQSEILDVLGVEGGGFMLVTLHRPSNVDSRDRLVEILGALEDLAAHRPVVFPMHPRTRKALADFSLGKAVESLLVIDPVPYTEMVALMAAAALVLTDSGGMQEETTALGVPCLTLRENTERPITIEEGTNTLVPSLDRDAIVAAVGPAMRKAGRTPELWDGRAAERIADALLDDPGVARGEDSR